MAKISVQAGSTSVSVPVFVQASTSTAGLGLTGLVGTSAGLQAWYYRGTGTAVPITLATSSLNAPFTSGLFVEVNSTATGIQGLYRFDPPDAAFTSASGVRSCAIGLGGAVSMAPVLLEVELTGWNNQVAVQTSVLAAGTHVGAVIPLVQTASNLTGTVVLAAQVHTNAIIPIVQTASNLGGTVVLAAQTHTSAVIPVVQTASSLGGTVVLAPQTHTSAVIPVVQTASLTLAANTVGTATVVLSVDTVKTSTVTDFTAGALGRFFNLDAGTFDTSSANSVVRQITTNAGGGSLTAAAVATAVWAPFGTGTVMLLSGTHSGAVIPVVQTASVALTANTVGTASNLPPVTLSTGTHTGAVIPTVNVVQTSADKTGYALAAAEYLKIATAVGTTVQTESYRGSGAAASLAQMGYESISHLGEHAITSTGTVATKNLFQVDGTSTAMRFAIQVDTSTLPTGIARA